MYTVFLVCAALGGSVFVVQFLLTIAGVATDGLDVGDDFPDDIDIPDGFDVSGAHGHVLDHGSTWFFGILTFRTVIAALLFFGLAGLAALQAELSQPLSLLIAVAAGAAAMYGVHYLMRLLFRLRHDGTVRIIRTVGQRGTVYIPIPANNEGAGKIQLSTQGRIMEYAAETSAAERLQTGTPVEVVRVISPTMLEVEPVSFADAEAPTTAEGD